MLPNNEQPEPKKRRRRRIILGIIISVASCLAVLALVCGAVVIFSFIVPLARGPGSPSGRVTVGNPAPDFSAHTLDGQEITLSDLRGLPVALNFWTTWCPECRGEMPVLESAVNRYTDDGLVVLAISMEESASEVQTYVDQVGLSLPILLDTDGKISRAYGIFAFPVTIWVDADGFVQAIHIGALTDDLVDDYVAALLE